MLCYVMVLGHDLVGQSLVVHDDDDDDDDDDGGEDYCEEC